jgi:tRNA dimethylallyltransferase
MPICVGGTGLYVKALVDGLSPAPSKDEEIRERLMTEAEEKGSAVLHERLGKIDPLSAEKINANDLKRIVRALEVYELTGSRQSDKKPRGRGIGEEYDIKMFGLDFPRAELYDRINRSVDIMVESGAIEKVRKLKGLRLSVTAGKALGVKEFSGFLDGIVTREEAVSKLKQHTRNYAKRQLTWFRADERVEWIDGKRGARAAAEEILARAAR